MESDQSFSSPWDGGSMEIEIVNKGDLVAGQSVTGFLKIELSKQLFPVTDLTVGIKGFERVSWKRTEVDFDSKHTTVHRHGKHLITNTITKLAEFTERPPEPGNYSYSFNIKLPEDLAASQWNTFPTSLMN